MENLYVHIGQYFDSQSNYSLSIKKGIINILTELKCALDTLKGVKQNCKNKADMKNCMYECRCE